MFNKFLSSLRRVADKVTYPPDEKKRVVSPEDKTRIINQANFLRQLKSQTGWNIVVEIAEDYTDLNRLRVNSFSPAEMNNLSHSYLDRASRIEGVADFMGLIDGIILAGEKYEKEVVQRDREQRGVKR